LSARDCSRMVDRTRCVGISPKADGVPLDAGLMVASLFHAAKYFLWPPRQCLLLFDSA
jgi:hypothetical protein